MPETLPEPTIEESNREKPMNRRGFVKLITAATAAAATGCSKNSHDSDLQEKEKLYRDYLKQKKEEEKRSEKQKLEEDLKQLPKFEMRRGAHLKKPLLPEGIEDEKFEEICSKVLKMVEEELKIFPDEEYTYDFIRAFEKRLIQKLKEILINSNEKFREFLKSLELNKFDHDYSWVKYLNYFLQFRKRFLIIEDEVAMLKISDKYQVFANGEFCENLFIVTDDPDREDPGDEPGLFDGNSSMGIHIYKDRIRRHEEEIVENSDQAKTKDELKGKIKYEIDKTTYHEAIHAYIAKKYPFIEEFHKEKDNTCGANIIDLPVKIAKGILSICFQDVDNSVSEAELFSLHEICAYSATIAKYNDVDKYFDILERGDQFEKTKQAQQIVGKIAVEFLKEEDGLFKGLHKISIKDVADAVRLKLRSDKDFVRRVAIKAYKRGLKLIKEIEPKVREGIEIYRKHRRSNFTK